MCVKHEEKTFKEVKMHKLLVCACKSQGFVQSQKKIAQSNDPATVTFRNSTSMSFCFSITCHLNP